MTVYTRPHVEVDCKRSGSPTKAVVQGEAGGNLRFTLGGLLPLSLSFSMADLRILLAEFDERGPGPGD